MGHVDVLRDVPGSGTCYNHLGNSERELSGLFGSNLQRLQQVKATYDPDSRFNCFKCVGYHAMLEQDCLTPSPTPSPPDEDKDASLAASVGIGNILLLLVALFPAADTCR